MPFNKCGPKGDGSCLGIDWDNDGNAIQTCPFNNPAGTNNIIFLNNRSVRNDDCQIYRADVQVWDPRINATVTDADHFLVGASGSINSSINCDKWSINQDKFLINVHSGL
jgi:hypothetical protein